MSTNPEKLDRPVDELRIGRPRSLEGVHGSVQVPHPESGFWPQWRAFVGPAILISVGYMEI